MTEEFRSYLMAIAAAAMAVSLATVLLRGKALRKALQLTGGIVLILVVLGPVVKVNLDAFGQYISGITLEQDAIRSGIEVESKDIMARIIQEKTEAYILDKAKALGAEVQVTVTVTEGKDYPYPSAATIEGFLTSTQQTMLSADLEQSLAIPKERQEFLP